MAEAPQTISADKLCALTGLTDRRHRQLASDGWFPSPVESQYLLTPTIQGMFRYYRESNKLTKQKTIDLKEENLRLDSELKKAKLAKEHRRVIDRDEVDKLFFHVSTMGRTELYQAMETELPPKLDGMGAAQMRPILREAADSIADRMAGLITRFQEQ